MNAKTLAKTGAVMYVLWGILHVIVGAIPLLWLFTRGRTAMLDFHNFDLEPGTLDASMVHAGNIIAEHSAELIAFGLMAIIVAVALNWKNDILGFWLNFIVLGIVDVAFVLGEIVPGYVPVEQAIIGPLLFVLGALFTGAAVWGRRPADEPRSAPAAEY